jgi:hypothetical protein
MIGDRPKQQLWKQSLGAILWGLFFILAPLDILLVGALLWFPALIWLERLRTRRYGFWPGALCRFAVVLTIIVIGARAPSKREDSHLGPFPTTHITLAELERSHIIALEPNLNRDAQAIKLPTTNPTCREVMQAITQQTGLRTSIFHCGNGSTILFGGAVGPIRVSEPMR